MNNKQKKALKNILLLLILLVLLIFSFYIIVSTNLFNKKATDTLEDSLLELYNLPEQRADNTYLNIISASNLEGKIKVPNILRSFFINSKARIYKIENALIYNNGMLVMQWKINEFAQYDTNLNPYKVEQVFLKRQFKSLENIEHENYFEFILKRENKGFNETTFLYVKKDKLEYINSLKHNISFPFHLSQTSLQNFRNIYPIDIKSSIDTNLYNSLENYPCNKLSFIEENKAFNTDNWELEIVVSDSVYNNIDNMIINNNYTDDGEDMELNKKYIKENNNKTKNITVVKKQDNVLILYLSSH